QRQHRQGAVPMTSKKDLQSQNDNLTSLNSELQETLERHRTMSNDLRTILDGTHLAILFLDHDLTIQFMTPAAASLFGIMPGDVGRPVADLLLLAADTALPGDARTVLQTLLPIGREIETPDGPWFRRRILPCRTKPGHAGPEIDGVVITFDDITRRKQAAQLVDPAKPQSLPASRHDMRQPLQAMALLQGQLARTVTGEKAADLVRRLDAALGTMTGMVDTLPELGQSETGVVSAETTNAWVGELRDRAPTKTPILAPLPQRPADGADAPVIFIVDDDRTIRGAIRAVLEDDGRIVEVYATSEAFLAGYRPGTEGCLLIDAYLPGMGGVELLQWLRAQGDRLPAIMITGHSDVPMAVQAMKAGASDFIEKPVGAPDLLASIARAMDQSRDTGKLMAWRQDAAKHIESLTPRQRQVMDLVLAGHPSKNIAADLGVSQRTVENHRASIMRRSGVKSLPALARMALAAAGSGSEHDDRATPPGRPTIDRA
ncbi:MAG: response regulator, partial [Gemmatimonadaceae bacterium]|nr:response regulator [Acetobacteraceae bacterium]